MHGRQDERFIADGQVGLSDRKKKRKEWIKINILYGCFIAFSMYSKLPVPTIEWTAPRMRYVLCWFPLVGVFCGGFFGLWFFLADVLGISPTAAGILGSSIPIFVTGGIHLDGFLDTLDARTSYAIKEKKLEILSDPHVGAFAVIGLGAYGLVYAGCLVQFYLDILKTGEWQRMAAFCLIFPLERAFSGLSVALFPCAKNSGLARIFSDTAHRQAAIVILLLWIGGIFLLLAGLGMEKMVLAGSLAFFVFGYYWKISQKEFGGITGDLAGWFLQVLELAELGGFMMLFRWMT